MRISHRRVLPGSRHEEVVAEVVEEDSVGSCHLPLIHPSRDFAETVVIRADAEIDVAEEQRVRRAGVGHDVDSVRVIAVAGVFESRSEHHMIVLAKVGNRRGHVTTSTVDQRREAVVDQQLAGPDAGRDRGQVRKRPDTRGDGINGHVRG